MPSIVASLSAVTPTGDGASGACRPRALVIVPTREQATLAKSEAIGLTQGSSVQLALAYGAQSIEQSLAELSSNTGLLIATPTRLLDLGLEPQLRQLVEDVGFPPPAERQTSITCVSMTIALKALVPRLLRSSRVSVTAAAAPLVACDRPRVSQQALFADERSKQQALATLLRKETGLSLVFVNTRRQCEVVQYLLKEEGLAPGALHGERAKSKERDATIAAFVSGKTPVLVTTDGTLRFVDLPNVSTVVSYDAPPSVEVYAERLSYTGCAGRTGKVVTLLSDAATEEEAKLLAYLLRQTGAEVPRWLDALVNMRPAGVLIL